MTTGEPTDQRLLADAAAIAADRDLAELKLSAATIRKWASRGLLERRGRDQLGRVLYDYDEVVHVAATRRAGPPRKGRVE